MAPPELRPRRETLALEEHCKRAFELKFNMTAMGSDGLPLTGTERQMVEWGWNVCWLYLQQRAFEEFIAK